jgi:hypothetical protein
MRNFKPVTDGQIKNALTNKEENNMNKKAKFEQAGVEAVVRVNESGYVELYRSDTGNTTVFPVNYSFEGVKEIMASNGWEEQVDMEAVFSAPQLVEVAPPVEEPVEEVQPEKSFEELQEEREAFLKGAEKAAEQGIPTNIQRQIDEYIKLHKHIAELNEQLKPMKEVIKTYMEVNNIKKLEGTFERSVEIQKATASNSTSRYSDYDVEEIQKVLNPKYFEQVTDIRIDSDRVTSLLKSGELSNDLVKTLKALKIANDGTPRFTVKK